MAEIINKASVCRENNCCGCNLCKTVCPKKAITIEDNYMALNARISEACINCGLCHKICPQNIPLAKIKPQKWFQGWADAKTRSTSSSGGFASAISKSFISSGGVVVACKLVSGDYRYVLAKNEDELIGCAGPKYVKSNPHSIYTNVKEELTSGKRVLFIGLPCHVAAIKRYIDVSLQERLYTIDYKFPNLRYYRKFCKMWI